MYGTLQYDLIANESTPGTAYLDRRAARLFSIEYSKSQIQGLIARLTGHNMRMLDLKEIRWQNPVTCKSFLGSRTVPIDRIRGSESRCDDFDINLRPRSEHNRGRWISVAKARLAGITLPQVELIAVGGFYFIRDGHHRVSIARALGEKYIDAVVLAG